MHRPPDAPNWSRCRQWRQARAFSRARAAGENQTELTRRSIPALARIRILHLERATAARKRRVGHEIGVRGESIAVLGVRITDIAPVRLHIPALRLVFELR